MKPSGRGTLLLALGNDILGDDGVGFAAARILREEFPEGVTVVESNETGLALLDHLEGFDCALLLDAMATGTCPPGTVVEYGPEDFIKIVAPSPHFAGLPEVLQLARRLEMAIPQDIRILAMEVDSPYELREGLTPAARKALPAFVEKARRVLADEWGLRRCPTEQPVAGGLLQ